MAGFIKGNKFLGGIPQKFKQLIKLDVLFDDQIVTQSKAMGPTEQKVGYAGMSEAMRFALGLADSMEQPFIAYFDTSYPARREYLKKFSQNSEIQWCLETICNSVIRFNDENYYMLPKFLFGNLNIREDLKKKVEEKLQENFKRIYQVLEFRDTNTAWHLVKRFLVEGFLCQEIIYDRTNSNIIGFKTLDPATIVSEIRIIDGIYSRVWVQNPDNPRFRRELLDNQVIYISYIKANDYSRVSYVENLIRNFNLMRLMEDTRVIWNVTNSTFRMKIILPVGDLNGPLAREELSKFNAEYKENVQYQSDSGELKINGKANILAYKNYIIPTQDGEGPTIDVLGDEGPSLQGVEIIEYFYKKFQMDSKIPGTRFFKEQPNMLIPDINAGMDREEERFNLFIQQVRMMFEQIIRKPLQIQMCLDFPELAGDIEFLNGFHFEYFSDGYWEERLDMKITFDRVQHIMGLMGLMDNIVGEPLFDATWLAKKYLKLSDDDWKSNEEYKEKAKKKAQGMQSEEPPPEDDGGGQADNEEQPEDDDQEPNNVRQGMQQQPQFQNSGSGQNAQVAQPQAPQPPQAPQAGG